MTYPIFPTDIIKKMLIFGFTKYNIYILKLHSLLGFCVELFCPVNVIKLIKYIFLLLY